MPGFRLVKDGVMSAMVRSFDMEQITNISAYRFAPLSNLKELRGKLIGFCKELGLKGTILLSTEGINLFVAGKQENVDRLVDELRKIPGLEDLAPKYSWSEKQPFARMLVRIKKEIIAFGVEGIDPARNPAPKLPPRELRKWLDEGREVLLLDTRNDYEVKLGTFRGAVPAGIKHFRDFPKAVQQLPEEWRKKPIVMFCTGGIRCEKAGPYMMQQGFENVLQLDGGILKYFEECGGTHYEGECFVFDQRVGVDPALRETSSAQCFACQAPLTLEEQEDPRYVPGKSCPYCYRSESERMAEAMAQRQEKIRAVVHPLPGSVPCDNKRPVRVPASCEGWTLLDFLMRILPHVGREGWENWCAMGRLRNAEGNPVTSGHRVRAGEQYDFFQPAEVEPDVNADIRIVYEDEALVVVDKPAPLPMHSGGRFHRNTLQNILNLVYAPQKIRPVHRLDAATSGLVVCARTRRHAAQLQEQFVQGKVEKIYLARVQGWPEADAFSCEWPIADGPGIAGVRDIDEEAGLPARTDVRVLQRLDDGTALLEARPLTGRTNQIRAHLWRAGYPICGDPAYLPAGKLGTAITPKVDDPPLCLRASKMALMHPLTGERVEWKAVSPEWG